MTGSSTSRRKLVRERRGAMLVFIAVAGVVLMGFLAMTLDVGSGARQRRLAQTAADAGAIGGGQEIFRLQPDSVIASATNEAVRNGFVAGSITCGSGGQIEVCYPPATGPYAANTQYVQVTINKTIPSIFGSLFNVNSMNIMATATAGVGSFGFNCVVSLDPTGAGALQIKNGQNLNTNCGVAINSNSNTALDLNNSGDLSASGASVGITGNYTAGGGASITPSATLGAAPVVNPLAYVTMPTVGACDHVGKFNVSGSMSLLPGVYCGGIDISAGSATANLQPGTYIIAGGGVTVGTSGVIKGAGVTIILTTSASYTFKGLNFSTGCKATLSAPTSGTWKGILVFQDPAAPSTPLSTFACSSDSGPELTGAIYMPNGGIDFTGSNQNTTIVGSVITKQLIIGNNVTIVNDVSSGSALKRLSLVL